MRVSSSDAADGWFGSRSRPVAGSAHFGWRLLWWLLLPPEGRRTTPTMTGFVLMLVCFGIGAAAYNAGGASNILFLALALLFSSLLLSGLLSGANFGGIRWRVLPPPVLRVGEPAVVAVELWNTKRLLPSFSLQIEVATSLEPVVERLLLDRAIQPGKTVSTPWQLTPQRRGREVLRVVALESSYPFGFLRKFLHSHAEREAVVLPARVEYDCVFPVTRPHPRPGAFLRRPGAGDQLYNIRRYQAGDQQRLVHWKATARHQRLMVRQLMDESQDGYLMVVDSLKSRWSDDAQFELMVRWAATLAEDFFRREQLLGAMVNGGTPRLMGHQGDLQGWLETLALLERVATCPAAEAAGFAAVLTFSPGSLRGVHVLVNGRQIGSIE